MKEVINLQGNKEMVPLDVSVKTIDGHYYLLSNEEKEEQKVKKVAWVADSNRRTALTKIQDLESKITLRRLREAILAKDNGWLAKQESLILTERNKLGK